MAVLAVDPNALNAVFVQSVIASYTAKGAVSTAYLGFATNNGSPTIFVTDNPNSATLSVGNRNYINANLANLHGHQQNLPNVAPAIFINPANTGKPDLNILIHEIGHFKWQGLGVNNDNHTPLFYRYLADSLNSFGITPQPYDSKGLPFVGPTSAEGAGIPAYQYNTGKIPSGSSNPDLIGPGGVTWVATQSPLTGEILQVATSIATGLKAFVDHKCVRSTCVQ
jgi:hypothetical protein